MNDSFSKDLSGLRKDYTQASIDVSNVHASPIEQFKLWFKEAQESGILEPNAMTLASVGSDSRVSARIVLLKGIESDSFVFYTNYESRKAQDLAFNMHIALLFFWDKLERQIRIEGIVEKLSELENQEYFNSRPLESKIGAIVSNQSQKIPSREYLDLKFAEASKNTNNIEKPKNWGGYKVLPNYFEFWQGRTGRLHDRIVYEIESDRWALSRLAP